MASRYQRLAAHLAALPAGQVSVELTFADIDRMVGGLPPSARTLRQWWANSSHTQALAWREAGWHVESVEFAERRVRFSRGRVGGTRADRLTVAPPTSRAASTSTADAASPAPATAPDPAHDPAQLHDLVEVHDPVEVRVPSGSLSVAAEEVTVSVRFSWHQLGAVNLDSEGKVAFPRPLPLAPGLYRMHFTATDTNPFDRFYIGETDNLRRRLASNYRNPGPRQQTSLRVNEALRAHLATGGQVALAVALTAELVPGERQENTEPLDLTRKAGRLLAESAALVLAQRAGLQLENLG